MVGHTRKSDYATQTDPRHTDAGGGCCCGSYRRGASRRGGAGRGADAPLPGRGEPYRPDRSRRRRWWLSRRWWWFSWRRWWFSRRLSGLSRRLLRRSRRLGLAMVGPTVVAVNDNDESGVTIRRFRHLRCVPEVGFGGRKPAAAILLAP